MELVIEHFDLDESVPEPNTPRAKPVGRRQIFPQGMPFLIDTRTADLVEPVLHFSRYKFLAPDCFKEGEWKKRASAEAALADLKDWWYKLANVGVPWDVADDDLVGEWLVDLRTMISGRTKDFLADATVKRRAATISEFYRWAFDEGLVQRAPTVRGANKAARIKLLAGPFDPIKSPGRTEPDPHPINGSHLAALSDRVGQLPSELARRWIPDPNVRGSLYTKTTGRRGATSRDRLAFELALTCGMRIDEIVNLEAAIFEGFACREEEAFKLFVLEITHTKGLVPREVFIPYWLMSELAEYVAGERAIAPDYAKRVWAKGADAPPLPWELLVNPPGAARDVGKAATDDTLERWFNRACSAAMPKKRKSRARGTGHARVELVVAHTFHDLRHSFAVMMYRALESEGIVRPWLRIQKLLGHASISTTVGTYLLVIDDLGPETLERLSRTFAAMRERFRDERSGTIH